MDIQYRKATVDDVHTLTTYRISFLEELEHGMNHSSSAPFPKDIVDGLTESLTHYFHQATKDDEIISYIAEDNATPVAFGCMVLQSIPGSLANMSGKQGYIMNIYTIPSHRGKGIGSEILQLFIADGKKLGLGKLILHASDMGIGLYRKLGFTEPKLPELQLSLR